MLHIYKTILLTTLSRLGSTSKTGVKKFWGDHSGTVFSSLSAEDADTQAVAFNIPEVVHSSLDEFHFSVKALGYSVVLREAEHPGYFFFPRIQRLHRSQWNL